MHILISPHRRESKLLLPQRAVSHLMLLQMYAATTYILLSREALPVLQTTPGNLMP